ncbi:MAG: hypothetical protein HZB26_26510 [Candidatus Hydrogenedentes bacterium]|nr:hypothetical protein [Candidatus Hydrogenedentota bacterium]
MKRITPVSKPNVMLAETKLVLKDSRKTTLLVQMADAGNPIAQAKLSLP